MLMFKPCENFLLLPPKILTTTTTTTTNSKPHLLHHDHHVKPTTLKAHFKSTLSSSPLSTPAAAPPSEEEEEDSSSSSLTTIVDFLMDSGGLSYEQALQVIREKPTLLQDGGRKPRSVIAYFESIGFSKTHISKAISKSPRLLVSYVEKTLKPKIQLFQDFGFSESDVADLIASKPTVLTRGVKTQIKPVLDSSTISDSSSSSSSSSSLTTTVDFLMDSGGLSYEQALQVIQEKPTLLQDGGRKPRSVIAYFESIGFSKTHISKAISKSPRVLVSYVEKTLKPKIQLFQDFGFSESDIAELIASKPSILGRGVKNHLKPAFDLIKSFVKTNEDLIKTIKHSGLFLLRSSNCRKRIEPNIDVLRQHGVPDSEIMYLIVSNPHTLMWTPEVFKRIVERIVSLGFKPETRMFSTAVATMTKMKKAIWDSKIDLLKSLGWSDEQILDAFRRFPRFLMYSRERMKKGIEFFKESLNWDASVLSQCPFVLNYSLKRRVIPRYAVLKCLMSKEIIKEDTLFIEMLKYNETKFLSKYVFKYQDQLPYLYEVYEKECMLGCEEDNSEITNKKNNGDVGMTV